MEGVDKYHYAAGGVFFFLNFCGQFVVGDRAKETILIVIGAFLHFIAAGLLAFSIVMLFRTIFYHHFNRNARNREWDLDMLIAYSLFCFTGTALSCVGVFLRSGSWMWHLFTILIGIAGAIAADPSIRSLLRKGSEKAQKSEPIDTWSMPNEQQRPGGMRYRSYN